MTFDILITMYVNYVTQEENVTFEHAFVTLAILNLQLCQQ